jgi:hypothetical protein
VEIVNRYQEVVQVTSMLLKGSRVAECALIVRDGPLGGAHHTEVVIKVGVQGAEEGVLSGETAGSHYIANNMLEINDKSNKCI